MKELNGSKDPSRDFFQVTGADARELRDFLWMQIKLSEEVFEFERRQVGFRSYVDKERGLTNAEIFARYLDRILLRKKKSR